MADFVFDPLRFGAMMLLGGTTSLTVPSASALTLTGLAPTLSFQLRVPASTPFSTIINFLDIAGVPTNLTFAREASRDSTYTNVSGRVTTVVATTVEVRLDETPSGLGVWSASPGRVGFLIGTSGGSPTFGEFARALAAVGVAVTGAGTSDAIGGASTFYTGTFSGVGAVPLTLTSNTPAVSRGLAVPSATALALTGLAPTLNKTLAIPGATALVLTSQAPSLQTVTTDTGRKTVIGPVVGVRIGLKIDPGVGD